MTYAYINSSRLVHSFCSIFHVRIPNNATITYADYLFGYFLQAFWDLSLRGASFLEGVSSINKIA